MAYQNVGTPRFYINDISYSKALGIFQDLTDYSIYSNEAAKNMEKIWNGNPSDPFIYDLAPASYVDPVISHINYSTPNDKNHRYYALLGHNFNSGEFILRHHWMDETYPNSGSDNGTSANSTVLVNGTIGNVGWHSAGAHSPTLDPDLDGFSIVTFQDGGTTEYYGKSRLQFRSPDTAIGTNRIQIGDVFLGSFYDMPHSPDLNLKLTYEYDGVKTIQTKGGATLSNASYTKPADWGNAGAWQLGGLSNLRSGRRVWDLSFSYLSDTDVFPVNASQSHNFTIGSEDGYHTTTNNPTTGFSDIAADGVSFSSNILDGTDFFSSVWNKTMGHLPFIFQPDKGNANPDQFAICRFDMKSLQYNQIAPNMYNIKLKIRETW